MTEKLLISQKQSPRKEIRHSGFYARCRICDVSVMDRYLLLIFDYLTECLFLLSNTVTPVRTPPLIAGGLASF